MVQNYAEKKTRPGKCTQWKNIINVHNLWDLWEIIEGGNVFASNTKYTCPRCTVIVQFGDYYNMVGMQLGYLFN